MDLPKHILLEENKTNNNNINLQENKEVKIDLAYITNKIDEITKMNFYLINNPGLADMSVVPGSKNPVQCICETNNKMIDFLKDIYESLQPKESMNEKIIFELINTLNDSIGDVNVDEENINHLIDTLAKYIEK